MFGKDLPIRDMADESHAFTDLYKTCICSGLKRAFYFKIEYSDLIDSRSFYIGTDGRRRKFKRRH
jgi:hypothetical protein